MYEVYIDNLIYLMFQLKVQFHSINFRIRYRIIGNFNLIQILIMLLITYQKIISCNY